MSMSPPTAGTRRRRTCVLAWLAWLLVCGPVAGQSRPEVWVIAAESNPVQDEVLQATRAALGDLLERDMMLHVRTPSQYRADKTLVEPDLIVTLGTENAAMVLRDSMTAPVLCAFLPQSAFEALAPTNAARRASALFLDQPWDRQFQLLRVAVPRFTHVGVVLGPESRRSEAVLRRAAKAAGVTLHIETISEERQLVSALYHVLEDSEILLAVPDAEVFNRNTAQNALLTTYRIGKPMAGYSRAYVNAGALLATYTTPAQAGQQLGESLRTLMTSSPRSLPPPAAAKYFSVEINERVAHSFGLHLPSRDELVRRLDARAAEGPR
jgi:putative ABC transport system substrate-binding protein